MRQLNHTINLNSLKKEKKLIKEFIYLTNISINLQNGYCKKHGDMFLSQHQLIHGKELKIPNFTQIICKNQSNNFKKYEFKLNILVLRKLFKKANLIKFYRMKTNKMEWIAQTFCQVFQINMEGGKKVLKS